MKGFKLLLIFIVLFFGNLSCNAQNKNVKKINTKINKKYFASVKSFYGTLNSTEFKLLINSLATEFNISVPINKAILVNYFQYGHNCYLGKNDKEFNIFISNSVKISNRISSSTNALDFFVYSNNYPNGELLNKNPIFILDNGFFKDNVFTLEENCSGFFIIKPNGDFMKHYGTDYYTEVEEFLKK